MEEGIFELAGEGFFGLGLVIGEGIDFGEGEGDKTGFNGVLSAGIKVEGVGVGEAEGDNVLGGDGITVCSPPAEITTTPPEELPPPPPPPPPPPLLPCR